MLSYGFVLARTVIINRLGKNTESPERKENKRIKFNEREREKVKGVTIL